MPQYNGPMYAQGPTAVGPYNLQGYQPTFGYNPQQTYMPQTPQPVPHLIGCSISANDQIPPKEIPAPVPAYTVPNPNAYYGCQQNCYQSCGC